MWLYERKQKTNIYRYLRWLNRAFPYQGLLKNLIAPRERYLMPLSGSVLHGRISPVKMRCTWPLRSRKRRSGSMKSGGKNSARESGKRLSRSNSWLRNSERMAGIRLSPLTRRFLCPPPRKPGTPWVLKLPMPGLFVIYTTMLPGSEDC